MIPNSLFVSENIIIPGTHSCTGYDGDVVSCCFIHIPVWIDVIKISVPLNLIVFWLEHGLLGKSTCVRKM